MGSGSGTGALVTYLSADTGSPFCSHCTNTSAGEKPFTRQVTEAHSCRLSSSGAGGSTYTDGMCLAIPLGLETLCFSGEGRSVWVTVHVNLSPDSQSSTQTEASPLAPKVPLA